LDHLSAVKILSEIKIFSKDMQVFLNQSKEVRAKTIKKRITLQSKSNKAQPLQ
jgi:phosphotransferase system HPr-like phosphotransfer protein